MCLAYESFRIIVVLFILVVYKWSLAYLLIVSLLETDKSIQQSLPSISFPSFRRNLLLSAVLHMGSLLLSHAVLKVASPAPMFVW